MNDPTPQWTAIPVNDLVAEVIIRLRASLDASLDSNVVQL